MWSSKLFYERMVFRFGFSVCWGIRKVLFTASLQNKVSISSPANHISRAPVVYHQKDYFYFGGKTSNDEFDSTIARLDSQTWTWHQVGKLKHGRCGHNVIQSQGEFLVVGGADFRGKLMTEKCTYSNETIICTTQFPQLYRYQHYPELFSVPDKYCHR